ARGSAAIESECPDKAIGAFLLYALPTVGSTAIRFQCYYPMELYRNGYGTMDVSKRVERRLKLHDLRILMSVAEAGSMSKAAKELATSQPAISRTIADLEHSLGVRLLDRGPHGILPTPYG